MSTEKKSNKKDEQELTGELTERAREVWLAGLGALASVEEEGTKLYNNLVNRGENLESKGKEKVDSLFENVSGSYKKVEKQFNEAFNKAEDTFEENVTKVVKGLGVPTQDEVSELTKKVEKLTKKVDDLSDQLDKGQKGKGSQSSSGTSTSSPKS